MNGLLNFIKKFASVTSVAVIAAIWMLLVLVFADYEKTKFLFWGGFAFAVIAFIIVGVILYLINNKAKNTVKDLMPSIYFFTFVYLAAAILLNTVYVLISDCKNAPRWVFIPNVIIILAYVLAMVISLKGVARVSTLGTTISKKVVTAQQFSVLIGSLIDDANDEEIKKALIELKDFVDYSDRVGIEATEELENRFATQIYEIRTMLDEEEPSESIQKKIKSAKSTWKTRNGMLATLR